MKKILVIGLLGILLPLGMVAHDFWIYSPNATPSMGKLGAKTTLFVGHGHLFPMDEEYNSKAKTEFKLYQPDGTKKVLGENLTGKIEILPKSGNYIVSAITSPMIWNNYVNESGNKAWISGDKGNLKNIISSRQYNKFAKSILSTSDAKDENYLKALGHSLEIIPLQNPNSIKVGEYLSVKVLFKGEPLEYAELIGTYAGFSNKGDFAYYTKTNSEGIAKIKINNLGNWMLQSKFIEDAPKDLKSQCNEIYYASTLTFQAQ